MITRHQLIAMFAVYELPTDDFTTWDEKTKNIVIDEYFNALSVVERSELQLEAMQINEDCNPFTHPEQLIELMKLTIRNKLHDQVAEVLRCAGLVSY